MAELRSRNIDTAHEACILYDTGIAAYAKPTA